MVCYLSSSLRFLSTAPRLRLKRLVLVMYLRVCFRPFLVASNVVMLRASRPRAALRRFRAPMWAGQVIRKWYTNSSSRLQAKLIGVSTHHIRCRCFCRGMCSVCSWMIMAVCFFEKPHMMLRKLGQGSLASMGLSVMNMLIFHFIF